MLPLKNPSFVEKDLYVTHLLQQCAPIEDENYYLVFCGGTCMTKAHHYRELEFGLTHLKDDAIWEKDFDYFLSRFVYSNNISFDEALASIEDIFTTHASTQYIVAA